MGSLMIAKHLAERASASQAGMCFEALKVSMIRVAMLIVACLSACGGAGNDGPSLIGESEVPRPILQYGDEF